MIEVEQRRALVRRPPFSSRVGTQVAVGILGVVLCAVSAVAVGNRHLPQLGAGAPERAQGRAQGDSREQHKSECDQGDEDHRGTPVPDTRPQGVAHGGADETTGAGQARGRGGEARRPAGEVGEPRHRGQGQGQPHAGACRLVPGKPGDQHHPGGGERGRNQESAHSEHHPEALARPVPYRPEGVDVERQRSEDPHGDQRDSPGVLDVALEDRKRRGHPGRAASGPGGCLAATPPHRALEGARPLGAAFGLAPSFGLAPASAACRPGRWACAHGTALGRHHNGHNANSRPRPIRGPGGGPPAWENPYGAEPAQTVTTTGTIMGGAGCARPRAGPGPCGRDGAASRGRWHPRPALSPAPSHDVARLTEEGLGLGGVDPAPRSRSPGRLTTSPACGSTVATTTTTPSSASTRRSRSTPWPRRRRCRRRRG